jgi:hypothetical protein
VDRKHVVGTVWNEIVNWIRQESAAATALVEAFIALGIAFGWWHWSDAQTGTVIGIVSALLGMFVRSQVTPVVRARPVRSEPGTPRVAPGPGTPPGFGGPPPQRGPQGGPPQGPGPGQL